MGMDFSDTTNKSGILQRIEMTLGMPDGAITGDTTQLAYFTSLVNEVYYDVVTHILASQDTWDFDDTNHTDRPIATTPLVAAQRSYLLPVDYDILKVKRVDITYDGTNYYRASPIDTAELDFGVGNDTAVDNRFSKTAPVYDLADDSISIYPLPSAADVASGGVIRAEWSRTLNDFTTSDTTQEPGFDRTWHELIPLGAAMKYAAFRNMASAKSLKTLWDERIMAMRNYYSRKQDDKSSILISSPTISDYS